MKGIKSLGLILGFIAIILVLVVLRISNQNLFKKDANIAIEASKNGANLILQEDLKNNSAEYLLVDLSNANNSGTPPVENEVKIPFENLLDKNNQKILKETDLKIVLFSKDISESAKAWVILNQLNFKNLYILQTDKNEEVLKYKFQPDTLARLE